MAKIASRKRESVKKRSIQTSRKKVGSVASSKIQKKQQIAKKTGHRAPSPDEEEEDIIRQRIGNLELDIDNEDDDTMDIDEDDDIPAIGPSRPKGKLPIRRSKHFDEDDKAAVDIPTVYLWNSERRSKPPPFKKHLGGYLEPGYEISENGAIVPKSDREEEQKGRSRRNKASDHKSAVYVSPRLLREREPAKIVEERVAFLKEILNNLKVHKNQIDNVQAIIHQYETTSSFLKPMVTSDEHKSADELKWESRNPRWMKECTHWYQGKQITTFRAMTMRTDNEVWSEFVNPSPSLALSSQAGGGGSGGGSGGPGRNGRTHGFGPYKLVKASDILKNQPRRNPPSGISYYDRVAAARAAAGGSSNTPNDPSNVNTAQQQPQPAGGNSPPNPNNPAPSSNNPAPNPNNPAPSSNNPAPTSSNNPAPSSGNPAPTSSNNPAPTVANAGAQQPPPGLPPANPNNLGLFPPAPPARQRVSVRATIWNTWAIPGRQWLYFPDEGVSPYQPIGPAPNLATDIFIDMNNQDASFYIDLELRFIPQYVAPSAAARSNNPPQAVVAKVLFDTGASHLNLSQNYIHLLEERQGLYWGTSQSTTVTGVGGTRYHRSGMPMQFRVLVRGHPITPWLEDWVLVPQRDEHGLVDARDWEYTPIAGGHVLLQSLHWMLPKGRREMLRFDQIAAFDHSRGNGAAGVLV